MKTTLIVNATLEIQGMDASQAQSILIDILSTNPTLVLRSLGHISRIPEKKPSKEQLFKFVITNVSNLIPAVKFIRSFFGCGLQDAKFYVEGKPIIGWRPDLTLGVLAVNLNDDGVVDMWSRIKRLGSNIGMNIQVIKQDDPYTFNPYRTIPYPNNGI